MHNRLVIDPNSSESLFLLRDTLSNQLISAIKSNKPIVFLCIGTDRSTGDSLGPLVGEKLTFLIKDRVHLYGNLQNPVHAKNLSEVMKKIHTEHKSPFIIAIDACLGSLQNVGKIIVEDKPLTPGAALNKDLPKVGNLSITGVVNISGSLEFMVLQNTRLYVVMQLAEMISRGVYHSIIKTIGGKKITKDPNQTQTLKPSI